MSENINTYKEISLYSLIFFYIDYATCLTRDGSHTFRLVKIHAFKDKDFYNNSEYISEKLGNYWL